MTMRYAIANRDYCKLIGVCLEYIHEIEIFDEEQDFAGLIDERMSSACLPLVKSKRRNRKIKQLELSCSLLSNLFGSRPRHGEQSLLRSGLRVGYSTKTDSHVTTRQLIVPTLLKECRRLCAHLLRTQAAIDRIRKKTPRAAESSR